jgi:endoglucanase
MSRKLLQIPAASLALLGLALALAGCANQDASVAPAPQAVAVDAVGAASIAGLNWADPRDNFVDDALVLSGLAAGDSYATVQAKADRIISGFLATTGANTVRLPINPTTATGATWASYTGAIDKALSKGLKVILCCWEGNSSRNGIVDNTSQFYTMWQTVVGVYGGNANVYFEVFNEPHGYSQADLGSLYATWLATFPNVPRGRVLLDGTGYAQNITGIGADSRFSSCLLSIHLYDFFYGSPPTTAASWEKAFAANLGSYASRAVLTEWGAFMTTGVNYNEAIAGDVKKSYVLGISNYCRQAGIASVYWPGLRTGDQYSLLQFDGTNTTVTNASGLGRVRFAWGVGTGGTEAFYPTAYYRLINRNSGQVVDVNNASTASAAPVIQYYQNGANNQQWQLAATSGGYYKLTNRNSSQVLDVNGASTANAAPIIQYPAGSGLNQQWLLTANADGYYKLTNRNSGQVLDVNGASTTAAAGLIQYPSNNGTNQQWLLWQQ